MHDMFQRPMEHHFIFVDAGPKGNAAMLTQENNKKDEEVKLIGSGSHCFIESEETSRRIHSLLYGEQSFCAFIGMAQSSQS